MTEAELKVLIESWENLHYLETKIPGNPKFYKSLMKVALYGTDHKTWRAAYLVDKINDSNPELLRPFLVEMIRQIKTEKNASKKRHFLKLISLNELTKEQQGFLFDFCSETLTSDKEPVAVRVHAMQILNNIAEKEPDFIPEIVLLMENEMENHSSAGIIARGKKLIGNLERLQHKLKVKKQGDKNNA